VKQTVRIIGGKFRGKKLLFPAIEGLRPTPDRVRETLFNWLMHDIRELRCLDAFAGSGALGFEAFSRGASQVTFLEVSRPAFLNLQKQVESFNATSLKIHNVDALAYLLQTSEVYDLIFLDPPFASNFLPECLQLLAKNPCLATGGLIYTESPEQMDIDLSKWEALKSKQAGQVIYSLYKKR